MTEADNIQVNISRYGFTDRFKSIIAVFRELVNQEEITEIVGLPVDLMDFCQGVFSSKAFAAGFLYLCSRGAVTALVMQEDLVLPEATAYRVLSRLRGLGILKVALKIPTRKDARGGPRPQVFYLQGATDEEILRATKEHGALVNSIDLSTLGRIPRREP